MGANEGAQSYGDETVSQPAGGDNCGSLHLRLFPHCLLPGSAFWDWHSGLSGYIQWRGNCPAKYETARRSAFAVREGKNGNLDYHGGVHRGHYQEFNRMMRGNHQLMERNWQNTKRLMESTDGWRTKMDPHFQCHGRTAYNPV